MKKTMLQFLSALLCLMLNAGLYAQETEPIQPAEGIRPVERVEAAKKAGLPFHQLKAGQRTELPPGFPVPVAQLVSKYQVFRIDPLMGESIDAQGSNPLELVLPLDGGADITLELVPVQDVEAGVDVRNERGEKLPVGHYRTYQGIVQGDPGSIAAITIFDNEVAGFFSMNGGNYVVGRLGGNTGEAYNIVYNESDLLIKSEIGCSTTDDVHPALPKAPVINASLARTSNCVRLYFETEYDMYTTLGTGVFSYVVTLFNQLKTLYNNDGISISMSSVFVWTSNDPYTATNTASLLSQFQAVRTSISGDLGELLTFRSVGGGRAAGFNGICNASTAQKLCVAGNLTSTFPAFPTYSWSVMVAAHEFGHLFGSRHTHACVWNGNNTAIDGCAGGTEGGCPLPPIPAAGGTIMSYCHVQSVGINFHLGFGPQPAALIRNRVQAGTCLGTCDYFPSCGYGTPPVSSTIAIKAVVNNKWVCAENAGTSSLIANRNAIGLWEKFIVNDAGGGYIALKAVVNYRYVCAENGGNSPLIANRTWILPWEEFCWLNNSDGTFSLRAKVNNKFVCAENAGNSSLIANRNVAALWEKFTWVATTPRLNTAATAKGATDDAAEKIPSAPVVYPNPAQHTVNVAFETTVAGNATLVISNLNGQELRRHNINTAMGLNNIGVDIRGLSNGLYLLNIQSAGTKSVHKFTVQQ